MSKSRRRESIVRLQKSRYGHRIGALWQHDVSTLYGFFQAAARRSKRGYRGKLHRCNDAGEAARVLSRDLKVVKEHSVWEQIGTLSGTAQKIFDFSQREEICLVTTCAGNAKLVYTVKIPVVVLSEDKIHVCNGGYTAGTGAQCEWEISKTSCRLLACYVGGTNYTGSATTIYAR